MLSRDGLLALLNRSVLLHYSYENDDAKHTSKENCYHFINTICDAFIWTRRSSQTCFTMILDLSIALSINYRFFFTAKPLCQALVSCCIIETHAVIFGASVNNGCNTGLSQSDDDIQNEIIWPDCQFYGLDIASERPAWPRNFNSLKPGDAYMLV